ncbi:hypothetical protein [Streptomyces gardneri]|uniref:hypothetical protein n=1 Tax=Streptomyces gardneri TaxID=66892 RepID=UPI0035D5A061
MPLHLTVNDPGALIARCDYAMVRTAKGQPDYEDGALIPSGLWQRLTEDRARAVAAPSWTAPSTLVEIVRPPLLAENQLDTLAAPLGDERAQYLGQALAKPDMPTTTHNYQDGRLIGLHLDNWDKLIYGQKPRGRRRLMLNLGPGTRYLILGALDAQTACRAAHPEDYVRRYPHTDDCRSYIAAGRPLHCFRIRLAPDEGYIAPTENLLHDGSTEGQNEPSAAAFWLGRWPAGTLPSLI